MNSLVKRNDHRSPALWSDPFSRFFRNDLIDFWNMRMPDTVPSINISEEKDRYKVEVAAPGLKKEDMNIDVDGNLITISSEQRTETKGDTNGDGHYSRREYNYSGFSRSFTMPENADPEGLKAKYSDGILCLTIPKKKQPVDKGPKKVNIE